VDRRKLHPWGAAAVFLAAAFLYTHDLGRWNLWMDEIWWAIQVTEPTLAETLRPHALARPPLLTTLLARAAMALLPHTEAGFRLVPSLIGWIAVLLYWRWARVFQTGPRLVFTALFAALPPLLTWTHLFKHYTADIAATLAVVLAIENAVGPPPSARRSWLLAAVAVLALGFSFTAAFWVPIVAVVLVIRKAPLPAAAVLAATAAYLWSWPNDGAAFFPFAHGSVPPPGLLDRLTWAVVQCAKVTAAPLLPIPLPVLALGLAAGIVAAVRERQPAGLWHLALLPLVALAGLMGRFPLAEGRFTVFLFPLAFMTLAVGLNALWDKVPRTTWPPPARTVAAVAAALALLAFAIPSVTAHWRGEDRPREQIAPAIEAMRAARREGDRVFVNRLALGGWKYYARDPSDVVGRWRRTSDGIDVYVGSDVSFREDTFSDDMRRVFEGGRRVFFVLTHLDAQEHAFVRKHAVQHGDVRELHAADGAWTWLVTPPSPSPAPRASMR
jgi:hypothetical protein